MPRIVDNPRNNGPDAAEEYAIGSVPVGSWVELWTVDDQMIYRGYVVRQSPWGGYTVVQPITEGDGNFAGSVEAKMMYRLYSMSDKHYVQEGAPCKWLGVDEELRMTLAPEAEEMGDENRFDEVSTTRLMSLVPVMSLIPEEVNMNEAVTVTDCEEAVDHESSGTCGRATTTGR